MSDTILMKTCREECYVGHMLWDLKGFSSRAMKVFSYEWASPRFVYLMHMHRGMHARTCTRVTHVTVQLVHKDI